MTLESQATFHAKANILSGKESWMLLPSLETLNTRLSHCIFSEKACEGND